VGSDFAAIGGLLANPARSTMLDQLLRGPAMSAGELSKSAGVAPSTGSEHLAALMAGGLIQATSNGRHRYFSLAGPDVADALEGLARICPSSPVRGLRQSLAMRELRFARTCYDHLAGAVGVAVLDALLGRRWLHAADSTYSVTAEGDRQLAELGIDLEAARRGRRAFARPCLDWTERRHHLAGALGAAVTSVMLDRGWFARAGAGRGLRITETGRARLLALGVPDTVLASR
jgi:DNA-binding transcriptional ArsR family regulator